MTEMDEDALMEHGDDHSKPLERIADRSTALERGDHDTERSERGGSVDVQILHEVMYALHDVSIGTHQLLYFSAMKYAKNYLDTETDTVEDAITELADLFDEMNVGTLRIADREDTALILELADNALTVHSADTDKPICYFISGYIAGYLENALDTHYVVNEVACTSQGEDVCTFKAQHR